MLRKRKADAGFTLIEIMVVIMILGLLATLVVQNLRGATDKAKRTKAMADIAGFKTALDRYYMDNGCRPWLLLQPAVGFRRTTKAAAISRASRSTRGVISTSTRATATATR